MNSRYCQLLLNILILVLVSSVYYFSVYKPLQEIIKTRLEKEYVNDMTLKSMLLDNTLSRYIEGAKSISSRSMIRLRLNDYINGQSSLEDLKEFTTPKYIEGVRALEDCKYAVRFSGSEKIVECGKADTGIDLINEIKLEKEAYISGIEYRDSNLFVRVFSPVILESSVLGYDVIEFENPEIIREMNTRNTTFEIFDSLATIPKTSVVIPAAGKCDSLLIDSHRARLYKISGTAEALMVFSKDLSYVYTELKTFRKTQIFLIFLLVVVILLILYIAQRKYMRFFTEQKDYLEKKVNEKTSELNKIDKKLKASEERWKFAIEGNKDGVWDWNLETNKVFFSVQWKKMLGYEDNEIENDLSEWDKRVHPDDKEQAYKDIQKHLTGEVDIYINEHRMRCKDGTYIWILDRGKVVRYNEQGKAIQMIGTHTDITERKNSVTRLKEMNVAKDKLFSIIGHDLSSPFNALLGFSEIALKDLEEKKYDRLPRYLGVIRQTIQTSVNLLNNLLHWSRIQSGRIEFKPVSIELNTLVNNVIRLLEGNLKEKNIDLTIGIESDFNIRGDVQMLETIIRNLLSNAIKFTHVDGKISILASRSKEGVEIIVKDNGLGIDSEKLRTLFDPDHSSSGKGTKEETGTGLGLILVKEFIERHSGTIRCESEPNKGSSFIFTIPQEDN